MARKAKVGARPLGGGRVAGLGKTPRENGSFTRTLCPLMCEPPGFVTEEPRETHTHNKTYASNADAT